MKIGHPADKLPPATGAGTPAAAAEAGKPAAAAQAGVADRVRVLIRISEADKAWYITQCLAYLQPSLAEGFGLPVVEAMQIGKPVFLSRLTSLPEVGGAAAYYFDDFTPATMQQTLVTGLAQHSPARAAASGAIGAGLTTSWQTWLRCTVSTTG